MRDSEVAAAIVAGDPDGLATAYDRYADPLYKYCRTLLGDSADAAGAVQDTFVVAASRLSGLRDLGQLRVWLYAVARNESLRTAPSGRPAAAPDEAPEVSDDAADASEAAGRGELRELFDSAAGGLSPGERELIELQLRQGLEPAEVASVLGVSRGHAHTLLSRARDQLAVCLAVLLVSRAGRGDCGELGALLPGWDGHLTVALRKRLHRHIENCAACSARRAIELRPGMLFGLAPAAALAAGATASFLLAAGAPAGLKEHTLELALGDGADAAAHRAAVLAQAGAFGRDGFPKPGRGADAAGLAAAAGASGGMRAGLASVRRSTSQGQTAVAAAVLLAVVIAAVAFALTASGQGFKTAADPEPPAVTATAPSTSPSPSASASASASPPARPVKPTLAPTSAAPTVALVATAAAPPATTAAATEPPPATTAAAVPTQVARTPHSSPTAVSPSSPAPSSAPTPAAPSTSPTPAPSPSPTPAGTLSMLPRGGALLVRSGGRTILLFATGGTVDWSATVSDDPSGAIALSSSAGTLTAASSTTLTVTASQFVPCLAASYPTITVNPGGTRFIVCTGFLKHQGRHSHRHARRHAGKRVGGRGRGHGHGHRRADPVAPVAPGLALSAPAKLRDLSFDV